VGGDKWRDGDRVFGITGGGAYAEFLTVDADAVARVPDNLSWVEAASVPEAFMTAHDALVTQAQVRRGETVLIHAVGSGVGLAGVQLARACGATPYGTARTAEKVESARQFGLADGLVVGDDLDVIGTAVDQWTSRHGIDVTLDLVGGAYVPANIRSAALRGRIMLIGTVAGRTATIPLGMLLGKRITLRGTMLRARSVEEKRAVTAAFARDVVPLLAAGTVRPVIDREYPLADARAAHERLASNATFGKVVLRIE
jgi:NADPH:quinone reductase-like Zn-dependent oxidoreductase